MLRDPKTTYFPKTFRRAGPIGGASKPDLVQVERIKSAPSIAPLNIPALSDDECLARLALAVAAPDSSQLEEVARLIGRLAVTIE